MSGTPATTTESTDRSATNLVAAGQEGPGQAVVTDRPAAAWWRRLLVLAVGAALLAILPLVDVSVPVILPGPVSSPGSMQILGIGLVFAGLAVSYDLLFGFTGLLSLGHALYFALGVYGTNLLMDRLGLPYVVAALVAVVATITAALGALALRARGVAFAMVTLGCTLAAAGGSVYLLLVRGANQAVAGANFTLALLVMVVLGGSGRHVRRGSFDGNRALAQTDYGAAATATGVASFAPPAQDGQAVTVPLSGAGAAAVNSTGRTQLRLRATTPINFAADQLHIWGGESAVSAPRLTVEYTTP